MWQILFCDSEDKVNIRSQLEKYNLFKGKFLIQTGYLELWRPIIFFLECFIDEMFSEFHQFQIVAIK